MRKTIFSAAVSVLLFLVAAAQARDSAYLADLHEAEAHVGRGGLGKNGQLGFDAGHHHTAIYIPTFSADELAHSLSAHAPSRIVYNFDTPYSLFSAMVAVSAYPHTQDSVVNFKVLGDGKVIWQSGRLAHPWQPIAFSVDISGITKLELVVETPTGHNGGCYSVWVNPMVSGTSDRSPTLTATPGADNGIAIAWAQPGTLSMRVERSHDGATEWKQIAIVPPANSSFQDTHLAGATAYYYRATRGTSHRYCPVVSAATEGSGSASDPVYLADMTEASSAGGGLKKGGLTFDQFAVPILQGLALAHTLSMQEEQAPPMSVVYTLGGKYQMLVGSVVPEADNAAGADGAKTVIFKVLGDGKTLWRGRLTQGSSDPEPFHIPVAGVNRLELVVCGEVDPAHGIWLEPQLLTAAQRVALGGPAPAH